MTDEIGAGWSRYRNSPWRWFTLRDFGSEAMGSAGENSMRARRSTAVVVFACTSIWFLAAPNWVQTTASAQGHSLNGGASVAPPIPNGPPLEVPIPVSWEQKRSSAPTSKRGAAIEWLQESDEVVPAGFLQPHLLHSEETLLPTRPPHPTPPPATFSGSACDFNPWCGNNLFSPDFHSYQVLGGYYVSSTLGPDIPDFSFVPFTIRKGWMLTAPGIDHSFLTGNWECLAGLTAASITTTYGHYAVSPTVHLRRNFLAVGSSIVPYAQLGVGFFISDAYKDKSQRAIGQACEYTVQAQCGVRFFVTSEMSIDVEAGFQHISNAYQSSRNLGVNAFGAQVGITYHFPWGVK
ncbi:MAG: hypothetical protein EXS09_12590 [Gemmataceae bacterium]|nr:hypothetical protein [Gemmataceae bacterium]